MTKPERRTQVNGDQRRQSTETLDRPETIGTEIQRFDPRPRESAQVGFVNLVRLDRDLDELVELRQSFKIGKLIPVRFEFA